MSYFPAIGFTRKGVPITNQTIPYIWTDPVAGVIYREYEDCSTEVGIIVRVTSSGGENKTEMSVGLWGDRTSLTYSPCNG
jgi:hypothetical protein